jgi:RHS repeat-associated protein
MMCPVRTSGPSTVYVYDVFGSLAAEYSSAPLTTAPVCGTCYLSTDHLGSTRLVTGENGSVIARHDYLPFGEEIPSGYANRGADWAADDSVKQKFTGQARDSETGNDFFNARYFNGALGRFLSPDPGNAGADLLNPQSWNGYGYVNNSPLINVDPDGMGSLSFSDLPTVGSGSGVGLSNGFGSSSPGIPYFSPLTNYSSITSSWQKEQQLLNTLKDWIAERDAGLKNGGNAGIQVSAGAKFTTTVTTNPPKNGLPTQTTNLFTLPGTNYCGPGGAGTPTDRVDAGCAAHDLCYQNAGVSWRNNVGLATTTRQQAAAIKACDADLSTALRHISLPTSNEMGQATLVSTYFDLPSGYSLRPHPYIVPLPPVLPIPVFRLWTPGR